MGLNKGKIFEAKFKSDWATAFPNTFLYRLKDQVTGFKVTSQNPCDYLAFVNSMLFMLECKSHEGASIPFTAIPQYERLLAYKKLKDVHSGFIIWFKEKDIVIWVDINVAEQIYNDGNKSIQLKMLKDKKYDIKILPSEKKRVYLDTNYKVLLDWYHLENN